MRKELCNFVLILSVLGIFAQNPEETYRMCVTERQATTSDCKNLDKADSKFKCKKVADIADCAMQLENGEADFGIFTAEEVILTSKFDSQQQRVVIAEIRDLERENEDFQFETVAVVKEDFPGTLQALRGKKFCHPGFSKSQIWSDRVLKHFERVVLNETIKCDKSLRTAVEDELNALSSFFSSACRPGEWVADDYVDKKLKKQYSNLCELCDTKTGCSQNPQRDGNQFASLDCLTKKGGDVAYVAYHYVQRYFGLVVDSKAHVDPVKYRYLCPNGTIQMIENKGRPCKWIQQPWNSIIARDNEIAPRLKNEFTKWLNTNVESRRSHEWVDILKRIITGNVKILVRKDKNASPRSYIQEGREIPEPGTTLSCHGSIKWCTTSDIENNKCEWMRQAAITQGIVPELECVQATSQLSCFIKLNKTEADIVGTDTNLGPIAGHFSNLRTVMYQETEGIGHFKVVAVVNSDLTATSMRQMDNKKACFPEFGGLAWIAFVEEIRNSLQLESKVCSYDSSMGTFFASVCAPGAINRLLGSEDSEHSVNLCALCSEAYNSSNNNNYVPFTGDGSCEASIKNKFYGDAGALRCLASGVADVAFINAYNLSMNLKDDMLPQDFANKYRIMCRNGTKVPLTASLDDECPLTVVTGGDVLARGSRSKVESKDLYLTLLELDEWFGYTNSHFESIFNLYEPFNNTEDLLFKRETLGFLLYSERDEEASIRNYANLKINAEKCIHDPNPSGAKGLEVQQTAIALILIATLLLSYLRF